MFGGVEAEDPTIVLTPPGKELIFRKQVTFQLECQATEEITWILPSIAVCFKATFSFPLVQNQVFT